MNADDTSCKVINNLENNQGRLLKLKKENRKFRSEIITLRKTKLELQNLIILLLQSSEKNKTRIDNQSRHKPVRGYYTVGGIYNGSSNESRYPRF